MTEITASLVRDLRERTGAGMMDCKKALGETAGDLDAAIDWLRKKGLSAAAKKSGRVAAEGLIAAISEGTKGVLLELNAETDFVARNDQFQAFARVAAETALKTGSGVEALKGQKHPSGKTIEEELTSLIATIGENMNLRRIEFLEVDRGAVASYVHAPLSQGLGKIGVLVALQSTGDTAKLAALAKQLAMHVAAAKPEALTIADVDPTALDRERDVFKEQALASGKKPEFVDKIVEGRVRKYYEEIVLMEQLFVIDGETRIAAVVEKAVQDIGAPITVAGFIRFGLGEGIERGPEGDFAAEVAAMSGA